MNISQNKKDTVISTEVLMRVVKFTGRTQVTNKLRKEFPNLHILSIRQIVTYWDLPLNKRPDRVREAKVYFIPDVDKVVDAFDI